MSKSLNTLLGGLMLAAAGTAFAASSVDLTVKGLITPSACVPALSNGGAVDYGKISAKDLNADKQTALPLNILQFTVTCDAATLMAMEAKDNREGSDSNNDLMEFGLGLINGTEKLGNMTLQLLNSVADGVPINSVGSYDGGVTWSSERNLMRDNLLAPAVAGVNSPIPVQLWAADLYVQPQIAKTSELTLTNEVAIDGSVTLTVRYL
ncbi:hypothetical protein B7453_18880 [Pseudomonas sp. IB20]|uniref:DUF1120 domain-containing protein n=1 Tax=Pseudomonas TaxID=286 RepID=UPI000BA170EE|nr:MULTISPECIES: DUF1120 domain-containing protein [unclassified Pseudomonas]MCV2230664.1 DUF1120 domain-containing protein [Pseudomonas sp. AU10]OZO02953.1 hypothetical protein B7453_18880 [Pseudomonas sp. IB20]